VKNKSKRRGFPFFTGEDSSFISTLLLCFIFNFSTSVAIDAVLILSSNA
jgi:hypothetical protein